MFGRVAVDMYDMGDTVRGKPVQSVLYTGANEINRPLLYEVVVNVTQRDYLHG